MRPIAPSFLLFFSLFLTLADAKERTFASPGDLKEAIQEQRVKSGDLITLREATLTSEPAEIEDSKGILFDEFMLAAPGGGLLVALPDDHTGQAKDHQQSVAQKNAPTLDNAPGLTPDSRLACQCVPDGSQDVVVEIPSWNRNLVSEEH